MDHRLIPVIINCRDRVEDLRRLVNWLEDAGQQRICLLDNDSTYEPLLEYLQATPHEVVWLRRNLGKLALWSARMTPRHEYFVYTDPDVIPIEQCPHDAVGMLHDALQRHRHTKAALGLYLDDVPPELSSIDWERELVCARRELEPARNGAPALYNSLADTTFALYRPGAPFALTALRTGFPYQARHTTWYRSKEPTEEESYYLERAARGPLASSWAEEHYRI